jgi:hypothetical protein
MSDTDVRQLLDSILRVYHDTATALRELQLVLVELSRTLVRIENHFVRSGLEPQER